MATASLPKTQSSGNLFNHQYRVRPTTVDQKRILPRNAKERQRSTTTLSQTKSKDKDREKHVADSNDSESLDNYSYQNASSQAESKTNGDVEEELYTHSQVFNEDKLEKADDDDANSEMGQVDIHDDSKWDTDIEQEEEVTKDFTCEGVYLEQCRKQKVIPASYFLRHMNDQNLTLKHHGLGAPGLRPVSAALMNNSVVSKLDLSDNWLGPQGAEYIARMLRENCFIYDLNLSENHLSTQGCEILRETLKQNNSLTHITLQGNNFDDTSAAIWADIISNTIKIEYLDLSHNNFGEESGRLLGPAIAENASIKDLNLSWNTIRRKGALAIAKGLGANSTLKKFDISWNGFSQEGAKAFLKTLKENETLEDLDLSNNRIATEGVVFIAKGLMTNQSLIIIRLGMNPFESAGCFSIIKALQKNPTSKLEIIDFSGIIVDKYFREEFKNFKTTFPKIEVKTGCDGIKLKPKITIHPIVKLRNYIEKHHLKLIDFFSKFDKDGSMSVTRQEFQDGVKEIGINLTEDELDKLMNDLDSDGDGEINYR